MAGRGRGDGRARRKVRRVDWMRWARGRTQRTEREREREIAKPDPLTSFKGTALFIESNVHEIPLPPKREAHLRICSAQYSRVIGREKLVANNVRIIHLTNLSILEERNGTLRFFSMNVFVSLVRWKGEGKFYV